jgi:outer membrane protein OmpA-like peptidoglycan-associated protein
MKTVLLIAFTLLPFVSLKAQEKSLAELKEYFYDAEYFFAQEEYPDALYDYLELYNNGYKEIANINYRIGICYLNIPDQKDKSINYLLEAVKNIKKKYNESNFKQTSAPNDAYLFLGNAYRVNNQLSNAIAAYNKYKEIAATAEEIKYADQQITACNIALRFMDNPLRVRFTNLGDSVNGTSSNYKGVVSGDGRTLLYMNELPFYNAVYFSKYSGNGWSSPINITPQIQSDGDQFVSSVSYDGTRLLLTREDAFNSDIYLSILENGKWSKSLPLTGQDINTKFWESHATVSNDGKTLYLTSNRKDGVGNMDIYASKLLAGGDWGVPVNLGTVINTPLNEDTPFITGNDSLLYFSSQGHENMGGYDIFVSRLNPSGQWSQPENVRYPINTTDDDLFYYPWCNAQVGYVSRIMETGYGKEDLYAVQPYDEKVLADFITDFFSKQKEQLPPALAEVKPAETPKAPLTEEIVQPAEPSELPQPPAPPQVVVPIAPKEIELDPVYFAFDNVELNEAGKKQLNRVFQLLNDYPVVKVRLIGHADAKGSAEYNLKLSEKRALSAVNYLTGKGIDGKRLETMGLGEKNFAAINSNPDGSDNPQGRGLNRRVEYEITGAGDDLIIIRMSPIPENLKFRK